MIQADKITSTVAYKKLQAKRTGRLQEGKTLATGEEVDFQRRVALLEPIKEYQSASPQRAQFEEEVAHYVGCLALLEERLGAAGVALKAAIAALKKGREHQQNTPMKNAIELMLAGYNIRLSQSYTMQLNGASCRRLVEQGEDIADSLLIILCSGLVEDDPLVATCEQFVQHLRDLWNIFDYVCEMLYSCEEQSAVEFDRFESACLAVGLLWRVLGQSVSCKMHALECMVPAEFRRWGGRIGLFNESAVERAHNEDNTYNRQLANVYEFGQKQDAIESIRQRKRSPEVADLLRQVEDKKRSKTSDAQKNKKEQQTIVKAEAKQARRDQLDILLVQVHELHGSRIWDTNDEDDDDL